MIEAAGGKLHHAFISLGSLDVLVIAELPDDASVAAVTLAVGAAGSITNGATTKLLPMSEFVRRARFTSACRSEGSIAPATPSVMRSCRSKTSSNAPSYLSAQR